ncbi:large neutral amino acids transporter, putative [Pediculus humanus corporis]|uniref:Large neutral amino acids transporter, putative n=1 Tax=Pediculus humanus subsp. corporis TaxID=121224 RepID=E0VEN0_PEDHC|nr:large neutral amino acids transporter, putative [Pediculus humanus corporis]EEB11836.1 large neutral amino acids transporter, putative [Pediculus humanus corporis]
MSLRHEINSIDGCLQKEEKEEKKDKTVVEGSIRLKKEIGLFDGVAIIVGVIIGSGIFVSPQGVLIRAGSVGIALIIWVLSGLLSLIGALCYAELGTMIPKSGGDYAYINEAFGPLPAFLYLWVALLILVPTGNAVTARTFAQYILQPLWPNCVAPSVAVKLIAALITCVLTAINCYNVKWVTRVQDIFTATKMLALIVIICTGLYNLCTKSAGSLKTSMRGTSIDPGHLALGFYSGLFSYSGWSFLNFVTEELKSPHKNLPRAICISMPTVTIVYVLTNVAYFVVLSQEEILSSNAVAVTFANKTLGIMAWTMPFFVACSTFGALNGAIFASSRLFFVGAKHGHLPAAIALININKFTPVPSLIFLCLITLILLFIDDVYVLINLTSFIESLFTLISVSGLLWLRYTKPELIRPIKVNLILPVIFFLICSFLVVSPCYVTPIEVGVGCIFILGGIPFYFVFIYWKNKPQWLYKLSENFNLVCAKLFLCILEGKE